MLKGVDLNLEEKEMANYFVITDSVFGDYGTTVLLLYMSAVCV